MSKSEMERLARKAWPDSERVHVDVDSDRDPNPFVEVYGELGGYKCAELSCCNERAVPAMLSALRVLAGEEDPELATLRAENERLKAELAAHHDADGILQSQLEAAQLEIDEGKAWRQRCEQAEAQLREAQATIERLKGELAKSTRCTTPTARSRDVPRNRQPQSPMENDMSALVPVILESPYAGATPEEIATNVRFARACVRDCLLRGEAPIASHLLYTQEGILRDEVPEERELGIQAGLAWGREAKRTVVYTDRGISRGMRYGIERAEREGRPVEYRQLDLAKDMQTDSAKAANKLLESALASAKPESSTPARPGWVAASVLREVASKWAARGDGDARDFDFGQAVCAGELAAIADTAGDDEAVERAAFGLVEERLRAVGAVRVFLNGLDRSTIYDAYRGALVGNGGEGNHV